MPDTIERKLQSIRINSRKNGKAIIDKLVADYIVRENGKAVKKNSLDICIFCGSRDQITKEHVLPKWIFEADPDKFFLTDVNGQKQTYNKTTVPACIKCNSDLLNNLEKSIQEIFEEVDSVNRFYSEEEWINIIRWLEIIDYKFQVLDVMRKFLAHKNGPYIEYLKDFPISMMRKEGLSSVVISDIRRAFKRISRKDKIKNVNSLIVAKSKNQHFHFFHQADEYIFIELPQYKKSVFYFYKKLFQDDNDCLNEAKSIIKTHY